MFKSRGFMFTASSVWVALIFVILVFRGGGAVPVEPRAEPLSPSVQSLALQAAALSDQGDYEGAWRLYYQALQTAPEDVSLWYALGVTLSRLDQRKATEEAFQYVVRHGKPDSDEMRLARRWLVNAGVLVEPVTFTIKAEPVDVTGDKAALRGKVTWGAPEPNRSPLRVQIVLQGLSGAADGKRFATRTPLGQAYRFERLPAGSYRLIGVAAGQRLWDQTLSIEDGRAVTLDLSKENSSSITVALYQ